MARRVCQHCGKVWHCNEIEGVACSRTPCICANCYVGDYRKLWLCYPKPKDWRIA